MGQEIKVEWKSVGLSLQRASQHPHRNEKIEKGQESASSEKQNVTSLP